MAAIGIHASHEQIAPSTLLQGIDVAAKHVRPEDIGGAVLISSRHAEWINEHVLPRL